jgi:hypothetical protein
LLWYLGASGQLTRLRLFDPDSGKNRGLDGAEVRENIEGGLRKMLVVPT